MSTRKRRAIEYLHTENQALKEHVGKKRNLLSNDQRRRLAVKGKVLGHKMLEEVGALYTPDTIFHWNDQVGLPLPRRNLERRQQLLSCALCISAALRETLL